MPDPPNRKWHDHPRTGGGSPIFTPALRAYAELHCKTNFSFLRGASHPEELAERAVALGYRALAVTDRNSLAGVVRMHVAAKRAGLKLLIGAEIVPVDAPAVVLLATDRAAYGRLSRLITVGRRRAIKGDCHITFDDIEAHAEGLIAIGMPKDGVDRSAQRTLREYRDLFGDRGYLAAELNYGDDDRGRLDDLMALSRETRLPLVAAGDVHYHDESRRPLHDILTCIRHRCTIHEAGRRLLPNARRRLHEPDDVARRFAACPEAVLRSIEIADRCHFSLDELRYEYPHELCPAGRTPTEYLAELTWAGAQERYHGGIPEKVRRSIEHELALIAELKYEPYFLTVWDLVRFARSRDILCQGRGSAANSAVCYMLGITAVDPARIDLLFERFISRERNEPPDIDVDFEHERREEVFQYIYEKYGRERAAITAEVITYRPRSAVRDVGKALGLSLDCVDALAKRLDWWERRALPNEILREAGYDPRDPVLGMLMSLVDELVGFPRHLGQHVGGFCITEGPLCETVPIENAAMPDRTFIEWDKDDLDALGLLKLDCLALGMLTCIHKAFRLLAEQGATGNREQGTGNRTGDAELSFQEAFDDELEGFSRSGRVAAGAGIGSTCVPHNFADAQVGTVWSDGADATVSRLDPEQHCRGKCASQSSGLSAFSGCGARIAGRTGDSGFHCRRPEASSRCSTTSRASGRDEANPAGPDPESPSQVKGIEIRPVPCSLFPVPSSLRDVPPEDPAVYDMICRADTVGVFQIESRAQMSMLPRLRPRNFYDLVIEVAIVRPGPIQGGMVHPYLRRRNGEEPVRYPSEAVRSVLEKTLGVPLFQEQAMRLAVVAAGFTPGEADRLRRAMAAWKRHGGLDQFHDRFVGGMRANGYDDEFAERCFNQLRGFGDYGFPESHAASFALLVYVSAWLKRYHPAAFAAALLNSQPMGFYAPAQIVRDARDHGVTILPPDVNFSEYDCTLEARGNREQGTGNRTPQAEYDWGIGGPWLRLGFRLIRGVSAAKVASLIAARRERPFRSVADVFHRGRASRETLARLAAADAFRSLGLSRREALWQVFALHDEPTLLDGLEPHEPRPALPEPDLSERVVADYEAIGLSLTAHPLALVRAELDRMGVRPNSSLRETPSGRRIAVSGLVLVRQRPGTAKGVVFITLEDETGVANLIVRPQVWDRWRAAARRAVVLVADGLVERQGEVIHVMVQRFDDLTDRLTGLGGQSRDFH